MMFQRRHVAIIYKIGNVILYGKESVKLH